MMQPRLGLHGVDAQKYPSKRTPWPASSSMRGLAIGRRP
jgi:hypothetical protein